MLAKCVPNFHCIFNVLFKRQSIALPRVDEGRGARAGPGAVGAVEDELGEVESGGLFDERSEAGARALEHV